MKIAIPLGPEDTKLQLNTAYIDYISQAGYDPLAIVPQNNPIEIADICDGLVLPGGKDIDPIFYGEGNFGSFFSDSYKDDFERQLLWAFIHHGKPVFGICRGFQLIAREYIKATGDQTVTPASTETIAERLVFQQDVGGHDCPSRFSLFRNRPHHYVSARADLLYGSESTEVQHLPVNSMHHQYLHVNMEIDVLLKHNKVTQHMRATAWTRRGLEDEEPGIVCEGIVIRGWHKSKISGVQWHPEELKDYALLHHHFGRSKSFKGPELAARAG